MNDEDRIIGSIIGGAIGDAWGSYYENEVCGCEVTLSTPWSITDDTQLTLATCEGIINAGEISPESIAQSFRVWYERGDVTGVGSSTLKALRDLSFGAPWSIAGSSGEMAAGNGAAMRIAPIAFCFDMDDPFSRRTIRDISAITHNNDEAISAARSIIVAINAIISGVEAQNVIEVIIDELADTCVRDSFIKLTNCNSSIIDASVLCGTSGYAPESVPFAVYAFTKITELDFEEVLKQVISCGGDTDTIASMAGQLMGCYCGFKNLPQHLVSHIPDLDRMMKTAQAFAACSAIKRR